MTATKRLSSIPNPPKSLEFFKSLTLFVNLPDEEILKFINNAQLKTYKKGQHLYLEGAQADFFYVVCSGWVKLFRTTEDGEEVSLAMLTKNNITGKNAIFEQGRFSCNAQIVENAQILSIPLVMLKEQLSTNHQVALNMLNSLVQHQRLHEQHQEQFLLYSAPQRIGCFLLGLCPALEHKDGVVLGLPYDKTLIASTLGMKGATFSRALNILRLETGLKINGTRVTIHSIKRLLSFVGGCYAPSHLQFNSDESSCE